MPKKVFAIKWDDHDSPVTESRLQGLIQNHGIESVDCTDVTAKWEEMEALADIDRAYSSHMRCLDCAHWRLDLAHDACPQQHRCDLRKGDLACLYTGPDFGCVRFLKKEQDNG